MRMQPARMDRLPEQYFGALLGRVSAAAADGLKPIIDLGRGNPETGPPAHVVDALRVAAGRADVHGYVPFRGLPELRVALASPRPRRSPCLIAGTTVGSDSTTASTWLPTPAATAGAPPVNGTCTA